MGDTRVASAKRPQPSAPAKVIWMSGKPLRVEVDKHCEEAPAHSVRMRSLCIPTLIIRGVSRKLINDVGTITLAGRLLQAAPRPGVLPAVREAMSLRFALPKISG